MMSDVYMQAGIQHSGAAVTGERLLNVHYNGEPQPKSAGQRDCVPKGILCLHTEGLLRWPGTQLLQQLPQWCPGGGPAWLGASSP